MMFGAEGGPLPYMAFVMRMASKLLLGCVCTMGSCSIKGATWCCHSITFSVGALLPPHGNICSPVPTAVDVIIADACIAWLPDYTHNQHPTA